MFGEPGDKPDWRIAKFKEGHPGGFQPEIWLTGLLSQFEAGPEARLIPVHP